MIKKILHKWFPKWFMVNTEVTGTKGDYKILVVQDTQNDDLMEELGVTEERREELADLVIQQIKAHNHISRVLEECSKECKHPNELAFVCLSVGRFINKLQSPPDLLAALLGGLGGPPPDHH